MEQQVPPVWSAFDAVQATAEVADQAVYAHDTQSSVRRVPEKEELLIPLI
jgi:hypothetical protein